MEPQSATVNAFTHTVWDCQRALKPFTNSLSARCFGLGAIGRGDDVFLDCLGEDVQAHPQQQVGDRLAAVAEELPEFVSVGELLGADVVEAAA